MRATFFTNSARPAFVAFYLWQSVLLPAQQQPAPAAANLPKFTSSTQLVVEIVSVKDKSGNIIEGLTAKDFTVTENGVPQTLSFVEFQKLADEPAAALEPRGPASAPAPAAAPTPKVAPVTATQIAGS